MIPRHQRHFRNHHLKYTALDVISQSIDWSANGGYTCAWQPVRPAVDFETIMEAHDSYGLEGPLNDDEWAALTKLYEELKEKNEHVLDPDDIAEACETEEVELLEAAEVLREVPGDTEGNEDAAVALEDKSRLYADLASQMDDLCQAFYECLDESETLFPMMNYFYELPQGADSRDAKTIFLYGGCLTIVEFLEDGAETGQYALALTGGGMDLTAEIAEAFVLLGYYPPTHFCRLPAMCGEIYERGEDGAPTSRAFLAGACMRSLKARRQQLLRDMEGLRGTVKWARNRVREQAKREVEEPPVA